MEVKNTVHDIIADMKKRGKLPQTILFYGEEGWGKTTAAKFTAKIILSTENPNLIDKDIHPDVIWAEHSGKLGGFSVDTVRFICQNAYIKPNNSDSKVYIFDDCDAITIQAQNALLKIVEEPPRGVYFIFTATSRNIFLPTMLSRLTAIGMQKPVGIGKSNPSAENLAAAILRGDEYTALVTLSSASDKNSFTELLNDFDNILTQKFNYNSSVRLHNNIREAYFQIQSNINIRLCASALCAAIFRGK